MHACANARPPLDVSRRTEGKGDELRINPYAFHPPTQVVVMRECMFRPISGCRVGGIVNIVGSTKEQIMLQCYILNLRPVTFAFKVSLTRHACNSDFEGDRQNGTIKKRSKCFRVGPMPLFLAAGGQRSCTALITWGNAIRQACFPAVRALPADCYISRFCWCGKRIVFTWYCMWCVLSAPQFFDWANSLIQAGPTLRYGTYYWPNPVLINNHIIKRRLRRWYTASTST